MTLKPYPAYKDSGVPWLGQIPEHWEVASVKRYYEVQLGKMLQNLPRTVLDKKVPYLKAQHVQWFQVRTHNLPTMYASPTEISQYQIKNGDLLVCEGGEGGRCAVLSSFEGQAIVQNALHRVRPISDCRNDFLQYAMNSISALGWFSAINSKATIAHFTREKFGILKILVPPPIEQANIARFLDWKIAQINKFIRNKRKLVALLKEQKQSIINEAVTRGINPDVRLKPSGVEWLGDIPEHWEVKRLKFLLREVDERSINGREPLYSLRLNTGLIPHHMVSNKPIREEQLIGYKRAYEKQIVMNRMRASIGMFAVMPDLGLVSPDYAVFDKIADTNIYYLIRLFSTSSLKSVFRVESRGLGNGESGFLRLYTDRFVKIKIPIPPILEQAAILVWIERQTQTIDLTITRAEREIELMGEYRTRLISDVVTGKVDVRDIPVEAVPEEYLLQEIEAENPEAMEEAV